MSALLLALALAAPQDAPTRPSFVLVLADDVSPEDLGCYGHPTAPTPHLDALAAEGVRFTNAYLTASSCSPSRCSLITGRYPHNTGAPELHVPLPEGQPLFPALLREAGYHTVLSGKDHMGAAAHPAFDVVRRGAGPGRCDDWVELARELPEGRPFFLWLAPTDAHRGWQFSDDVPRVPPDDVVVPPFLVDGPRTREDLAAYHHEVARIDARLGALRAELERLGRAEETYVLFLADNGRPFPRCKTRLYDSGIRTPLLVAHPGTVAPGVAGGIVSAIDVASTVLDLAGVEPDPRMQGVSFAPVLDDPERHVRGVAFAEQNWHVHRAHVRMVRTGEWLYLRNAWPERRLMCVEAGPRFPAGAELWAREEAGELRAEQRDVFLAPRPAEELYHVPSDPHQLANLAEDDAHEATRARLAGLLDRWTEETGDTVPTDPTPDRETARNVRIEGFRRGEMPGAARDATGIAAPGPR